MPLLPGFLVAFIVLVIVNSLGWIPAVAGEGLTATSRWCLVAAVAALGMKTSLQKLAVVGWRPIALIVLEAALLFALVLGITLWFGLGS